MLVAIGRRPYTEGLGLETVGLASDRRGMLENQGQRSAAPGVWVIGDVTSGPMLAHKARGRGDRLHRADRRACGGETPR
ncbi:FAD-dependent oxidoreductase [Pseudomonas aeruginosa]